MSSNLRIATAADEKAGPSATINARQLAAFRTFLRDESRRTDTVLLDPDTVDDAYQSRRRRSQRLCRLT